MFNAMGPLHLKSTGNKYRITAMCLVSKYPDVEPVADRVLRMSLLPSFIYFAVLYSPKLFREIKEESFIWDLILVLVTIRTN